MPIGIGTAIPLPSKDAAIDLTLHDTGCSPLPSALMISYSLGFVWLSMWFHLKKSRDFQHSSTHRIISGDRFALDFLAQIGSTTKSAVALLVAFYPSSLHLAGVSLLLHS